MIGQKGASSEDQWSGRCVSSSLLFVTSFLKQQILDLCLDIWCHMLCQSQLKYVICRQIRSLLESIYWWLLISSSVTLTTLDVHPSITGNDLAVCSQFLLVPLQCNCCKRTGRFVPEYLLQYSRKLKTAKQQYYKSFPYRGAYCQGVMNDVRVVGPLDVWTIDEYWSRLFPPEKLPW